MIDSDGSLRCDGCNKLLGKNLIGRVEIVCPRSRCRRFNVFESNREYNSHKLAMLDKLNKV